MNLFRKLNKKLIYHYFFSYLLIFLVPFILLTTILYYTSISSLRLQLETTNQINLEQVQSLLYERFLELENLAKHIQVNPRLTRFMLNHPYYSIEGQSEIKKIQLNSSLIKETYIYFHQDDYFYSAQGSYTLPALVKREDFSEKFKQDTFLENIHTMTTKIGMTPQSQTEKSLGGSMEYYVPLKNDGVTPYATVIYFLRTSDLQKYTESVLANYNGSAFLTDLQGNIIASASTDETNLITSEDLSLSTFQGSDNFQIGPLKYVISKKESVLSKLNLITLIDANHFFAPINNVRNLIFILTLITLLVGLALSFWLSLKHYRPVKKLTESFKAISSQLEKEEEHEWVLIHNRVTNFITEQQRLNRKLRSHQGSLITHCFSKLLEGNSQDEQLMAQELATLKVDLTSGRFSVLLIDTNFSGEKSQRMMKKTVLTSHFPLTFFQSKLYAVEFPSKELFAIILQQFDQPKTDNLLETDLVIKIKAYLDKLVEDDLYLSCGGTYQDFRQLNHSYIEALSAMDQRQFDLTAKTFYFKTEQLPNQLFLRPPTNDLLKLNTSVQHGDQLLAAEILTSLFNQPTLITLSHFEASCFYFDILNSLLATIHQLDFQELLARFKSTVNYHSLPTLQQELQDLVSDACLLVTQQQQVKSQLLDTEIIDYLNRHYKSHNLSLEKMALDFKFSISYLSRLVKELTGQTFSKYIQDLRFNFVKMQLIETDLPIKAIILEVGYYDVSNFTRKFKAIVGLTPGQYRVHYRKNTAS